ncbi:DUF1824 family protein [Spirulina sp. CCNP1310]|uniref:DUF1824 family protein n=1 Tax=Spirulina sp. CCNP1310 TaxID=3110249 RepID=UPI002B218515|nr:DUF1824 family protein [Spirulina sp. CCNP1310]MEA5418443.1 DUF1824 family protein [Spirulina sp. CCNP1310]
MLNHRANSLESQPHPMSPSLTAARQLLNQYSCVEQKQITSDDERQALQNAILQIVEASEGENFGICADHAQQGYQALASYLAACGYPVNFDWQAMASDSTPVYIKFIGSSQKHYAEPYEGEYRGVLVSCQSEDDLVNGTYGHLPLDLFNAGAGESSTSNP